MSTEKTDIIGGFPQVASTCNGCGKELLIENAWMTDGCPCNSLLGVNSMNETRWRLLMQLQQRQQRQLADTQAGEVVVMDADKALRDTLLKWCFEVQDQPKYWKYFDEQIAAHRQRACESKDRRIAELEEWINAIRNAVAGAIKDNPQLDHEWAGDKTGWGFHFEWIRWVAKQVATLMEEIESCHAGELRAREDGSALRKQLAEARGQAAAILAATKHLRGIAEALASVDSSAGREYVERLERYRKLIQDGLEIVTTAIMHGMPASVAVASFRNEAVKISREALQPKGTP